MSQTPESSAQPNQDPQPWQPPRRPTRNERLATYSPKVRTLRVALLASGIASVLPFAAIVLGILIAFAQLMLCISNIGQCTNDLANNFGVAIVVSLLSVSVGWTLTIIAAILSVTTIVLAALLLNERYNSAGTEPAIGALVICSIQLAMLAIPFIIYSQLQNAPLP